MLRASADTAAVDFDFTSIANRLRHPGRTDVEHLFAFTDALVQRTAELDVARHDLLQLVGPAGLVAAAGAAGNFEMMNRILDATGVPVPRSMRESIGPMIGLTS